jgi:hypothetical protein
MCIGEAVGYAVAQLTDYEKVDYAKLSEQLRINEYIKFFEEKKQNIGKVI